MSEVAGEPTVGRPSTSQAPRTASQRSAGWTSFVVIAGVVFPVAAIGCELLLRFCSSFFNVIPTGWHLLLLCLVPLANLLTIVAYGKPEFRPVGPLAFLVGASIGTSLFYSIEFVPLVPISLAGAVVFGLGLLGLSPYLALASSIFCGRRLAEAWFLEGRKRRLSLTAGILVSVLILGGFLFTSWATQQGLRMAVSNDEATSLRGVKLIRTFGSEAVLLRACYELPIDPWAGVIWDGNWQNRVTRDQARTVYYRVTGTSFNSVPPPRLVGPRSRLAEDFDWDSDVGGTAVNGIARSVSLGSSRIDSVVDPKGMTAYTEWTLTFANASTDQREARAEIALPPGGAVSRLTLWINGEEREAAFGPRGVVRQAYQQVAVVQRRDPVLVTTCGPDRVLMQCFPIPPNGGTMKVRLGITSPLEPDGASRALLRLPRFVERNFSVPEGRQHALMIESPNDLVFEGDKGTGSGLLRKTVSDDDLAGSKSVIVCSRNRDATTVWCPDPVDPRYAVVQTLKREPIAAPRNVVFVVDCSRTMRDSLNEIAEALRSLPSDRRFSVIGASDEVINLARRRKASPAAIANAQESVRGMSCAGGIDNRPALTQACERAVALGDSVVVWVHGPQPLTSDARTEQLLQLVERSHGGLRIIAVAAADGRNGVVADLEHTGVVERLPRSGSLAADLRGMLRGWREGATRLVLARERVPIGQASGVKVSSHIARLWAQDEVMRVCRTCDSRGLPDAAALTTRYQVVTPVSGAVVLENEEQYEQAKLRPADPKSVPSMVPEPASWLVLAAGAGMLAIYQHRRRVSKTVQ